MTSEPQLCHIWCWHDVSWPQSGQPRCCSRRSHHQLFQSPASTCPPLIPLPAVSFSSTLEPASAPTPATSVNSPRIPEHHSTLPITRCCFARANSLAYQFERVCMRPHSASECRRFMCLLALLPSSARPSISQYRGQTSLAPMRLSYFCSGKESHNAFRFPNQPLMK